MTIVLPNGDFITDDKEISDIINSSLLCETGKELQ